MIGFVTRWLRRIQRLALIASIAAGVYRWWQQSGPGRPGGGGGSGRRAPIGGPSAPSALRAATTPEPEPELVGAASASRATLAGGTEVVQPDSVQNRAWVEPRDGGVCPAGHPVKANDSSGIYHVPGGRFYDRTVAVRCYASPEAAAADGYRPAKA
jgi:hypothetical protein